jgi:uncharacterized protein
LPSGGHEEIFVAVSDNFISPLTDEELDFLESFLLDRIDNDVNTLEMDEGVLCVSELDGFLTAIVSGPETVMPSAWLPAVWGDFPPEFDAPEDAERVMSMLMRHANVIARQLLEEPESFEPMFMQTEHDGKAALVVDEWCEGYIRGVGLSRKAWESAGSNIRDHLVNILAFSEVGDWLGHDSQSHAEVELRQQAITPSVRALHAYWLARRQPDSPPAG